ncbi:hypothetical protein NPS53_09505 [Pseudomonas putida]|uniref:hypothetical protein n=1 Tax=Pseudomonas putida TaxID=303 RepID=UPI0023636CA1|nr:hypothetical protein [Pseudomonas putida]MDD2139813.1 hypothetical protein [Pseudomonas putida]HDS1721737.1 hypothetical protein [Pseudomonas putida]
MARKIIQISTISPGHSFHPAAVALADDGSVWVAGYDPEAKDFNLWQKLPALPATDEEAARLLEERRAPKEEPQLSFWGRVAKWLAFA